jgi:hypothetical protein
VNNYLIQERKKKKKDLLIQISTVRPLLNGTTLDGKRANYAPLFIIPRYPIILLAAITIPTFKEYADIEDSDCIKLYRLYKIADSLLLDFDGKNDLT